MSATGNTSPASRSPRARSTAAGRHAPLAPDTVRVTFADGEVRDVDIEQLLDHGVCQPLRDPARFAEAHLDPETHTLAWPGGVDLDPDVIYGLFEPASQPSARVSTPQRD